MGHQNCNFNLYIREMNRSKAIPVPSEKVGGLKGFFQRAGSSFYTGGLAAKEYGYWLGLKGVRLAFIVATTSIVVFMPLIFELQREIQSLENEKLQVKDFRSQGYSDRQLSDLGFSEVAIRGPSVALKK